MADPPTTFVWEAAGCRVGVVCMSLYCKCYATPGGDTQQGGAAACVIQLDAPRETLGFPYVCSGS